MDGASFEIRSAQTSDAAEIAALLRRSITELCAADHENDPVRLNSWLENKTAETAQTWIGGPGKVLVAESRENPHRLVGVGMALPTGEVVLNYVHPEARFCGVSKALMWSLEEELSSRGLTKVRLRTTRTAELFYRSLGYIKIGSPEDPRDKAAAILEKDLKT